ncbi:hypothetical protein J6590_018169, partial [Homalodisca vitripennis]
MVGLVGGGFVVSWQGYIKGRNSSLCLGRWQGVKRACVEHYYQPQYKYRIADTYATTADLTLVDPCVNQESKVIVSTRDLDDTQVVRTQNTLEEKVQDTPYINQPLRHRPMVPGFDAFIDALRGARGQRYEFTHHSPEHIQLQQQIILQKGRIREPLKRNQTTGGQYTHQPHSQQSVDDIPYGYGKYGENPKYTNSTLCDFATNYRRRQSSEWAPANISRPDPPAFDVPGEIYTQHTGLLPGYSAHVPGALFRSWLRQKQQGARYASNGSLNNEHERKYNLPLYHICTLTINRPRKSENCASVIMASGSDRSWRDLERFRTGPKMPTKRRKKLLAVATISRDPFRRPMQVSAFYCDSNPPSSPHSV